MQLFLSHGLQVPGAGSLAPDELRDRMEERFAWALGRGHAVGVLACDALGLEGAERRSAGITPRLLGTLAVALGPPFRVAEALVDRGKDGLIALLVGPDTLHLETACREWVRGARELRVEGAADPFCVGLRIGYSITLPGKRLFLETLIQVAREGLRVARCRGSGACVHTMLYDLLQARLESERGTQGIPVTACEPLPPGTPVREPGVEHRPDASAANGRAVLEPSPRRAPADGPREVLLPVPRSSGPGRERELGTTDRELRERMLAEALELQQHENDALRARLQALEGRDHPSDGPSGTLEARNGSAESAQDRIDVLERRLAKLRLSLAEAEQQLAQASQANAVDPGVASCYRTVQGLDADTPQRDLKAALMASVFAANLALHESLGLRRWPTS